MDHTKLTRKQAVSLAGVKAVEKVEEMTAEWRSRIEHVNNVFSEDSFIEGDWYTAAVTLKSGIHVTAWYWQPYPECVEVEELDQLDWTVDHYEIL